MINLLIQFWQNFSPWFYDHGIKIIGILIGAYFLRKFAKAFIEKLVRRTIVSDRYVSPEAEKKREDTLIKVFDTSFRVLVWVAALLMIIQEFGINIGPLLAGVGVFGLAIGFGAQYVIRDFLTGLFIIFENQYRVGDWVCADSTCGEVENIDLRKVTLRDLDGTVHYVSNGLIKIASNYSKEFGRINFNIGVAYSADLDKVREVVNQVGQEIAKDAAWQDQIREAPYFLRVDEFADSAIMVKIYGETKPLKQWAVAGELRRRLKKAFDEHKIEIPFPQMVIHQAKQD